MPANNTRPSHPCPFDFAQGDKWTLSVTNYPPLGNPPSPNITAPPIPHHPSPIIRASPVHPHTPALTYAREAHTQPTHQS